MEESRKVFRTMIEEKKIRLYPNGNIFEFSSPTIQS
jgi:hypothetical protein